MKDEGLWVRAQLDKASKYYDRVKQLIDAGALGWSSAAPDHKAKVAKDGHIDLWPVIEFSLTPTPAKPNLVAYAMKSEQLEELMGDPPKAIAEWGKETAKAIAEGIDQAHEGDSEPETLADHSERVLAGVKAWVERVSEKADFRAKSGRELSKRNIETLREAHRIIGELLERTDAPTKDEAEAAKAYAEFLRAEAALLGVTTE